ncbi:MAG: hypothetical protein BroJett013_22830 [Alphaproteobacteria bacterium]|nr:MAG: hypothetical protein BroJett013_22830 [Alphaproteobacteria bacterium]
MPEQFALDNDVVLKACCYDIATECVGLLCSPQPALMLATAPFVLRDRVARSSKIKDRDRASRALDEWLKSVATAEPTDDEIALAASLEEEATKRGLELDTGESILFALLFSRDLRSLLTGDKRAVAALEGAAASAVINKVAGRVGCFEQLIGTLLDAASLAAMRSKICSEPDADRATSICFSCSGSAPDLASVRAGLASYIGAVRTTAPRLLAPGDDLRSIPALPQENGVR